MADKKSLSGSANFAFLAAMNAAPSRPISGGEPFWLRGFGIALFRGFAGLGFAGAGVLLGAFPWLGGGKKLRMAFRGRLDGGFWGRWLCGNGLDGGFWGRWLCGKGLDGRRWSRWQCGNGLDGRRWSRWQSRGRLVHGALSGWQSRSRLAHGARDHCHMPPERFSGLGGPLRPFS